MEIIFYLLRPEIFYGILAGIFILSLIISFISWIKKMHLSKNYSKNKDSLNQRIEELETLLLAKEGENKKNAINTEATIRAKENEYKKIISDLKQELSIKNKMYEGLKSQYDELEKTLENMSSQPQEQDKTKPPVPAP